MGIKDCKGCSYFWSKETEHPCNVCSRMNLGNYDFFTTDIKPRIGDKYIVEIENIFVDSSGNECYKLKGSNTILSLDEIQSLTKDIKDNDT